MSSNFVEISKDQFDRFLVDVNYPFREFDYDWTKEYIFECRFRPAEIEAGYIVRLYTSIDQRGVEKKSRDKGKDAIRVVLLYHEGLLDWEETGEHLMEGELEPMKSTPHTKRTTGWQRRVKEKIEDCVAHVNEHKTCPECNRPMKLRENQNDGNQFWGCLGWSPNNPQCSNTEPYNE